MDSTSRVNIYINNEEGRKALHEMEDAIRKNDEALAKLTATGKKNSEQAKALRAENERLTKTLQEQKREVGLTALSYSELKKQYQSVYREWAKAIPGSEHRAALEKQLGDIKEQIDASSLSSKKSAQVFEQSAQQINSGNILMTLSTRGFIGTLKALWATIIANPIGALLASVGLLWPMLKKLADATRKYNAEAEVNARVFEKVGEAAGEQRGQLELLYSILTDNNIALDDRRKALEKIQAQVPEYHGALTQEGVLINDNSEALDKYIEKLYATALAQAYMDEQVAISKKKADAEFNLQQKQARYDAMEGPDEVSTGESGMEGAGVWTKAKTLKGRLRDEIEKDNKEYAKIVAEHDFVVAKIKYAIANGTISGLTGIDETTVSGGDTATTAADGAKELRKAFEQEKQVLDQALAQQILAVKQAQAEGKKNEQTAADEIKSLKARHLNSLLELQEKYGQDTVATQTEMADIAIANAKTEAERAMAITRRFLKDRKAAFDTAFKNNIDTQTAALQEELDTYQKYIEDLRKQVEEIDRIIYNAFKSGRAGWISDIGDMVSTAKEGFAAIDEMVETGNLAAEKGLKKKIELAAISIEQIATTILQQASGIANMIADAAYSAEEERYNKALGKLQDYYSAQIDAAAGNEDEQQRLREEYADKKAELDYQSEVKKLEIEKKAADAQFAINVATATAQAALAIVQCYAQLGPLGGSIAAAVVGGITAVQIYAMKKQRDAIKSKTIEAPNLSSSSSGGSLSSTGTAREITPPKRTDYVRGYEDGGYTDVIRAQDGRRFRAKVNPRGRGYIDGPELLVGEKGREFVANADAVNNPHIRPVFDIIDQAQRRGTVGRLNMRTIARSLGGIRARGYAAGGYTGADGGGVVYGDNGPVLALLGQIHDDILQLKEAIRTEHRAYVVLSDLNAMQQKLDTAKNLARL